MIKKMFSNPYSKIHTRNLQKTSRKIDMMKNLDLALKFLQQGQKKKVLR